MRSLIEALLNVLNRGRRLTPVERRILDAIGSKLPLAEQKIWDAQIESIYKVQRLPDGVEVNFYMHDVAGTKGDVLPRFSNTGELCVATVSLSLPVLEASAVARVWCVSGRLFSIEYDGSIRYFDEAVGMEPAPELVLSVELHGRLSASV